MKILVTGNYFKTKVDPLLVKRPLIFSVDGKKEIDILLSYSDKGKHYVYIDVRRFKGKEISYSYEGKIKFTQVDSIPLEEIYQKEDRPFVHFTAPTGHLNDPNGLLYHEGKYHVFFQNYPYAPEMINEQTSYGENGSCCYWHRQHWGHLVTQDFINYEYYPIALHHDKNGSIWSGSGVVDKDNVSGLGDGKTAPILLFYTQCGDPTFVNKRKKFVQKMAYSVDGGINFIKHPTFEIPHVEGANRDPKVTYCEEIGKWILALYLDRDDYSIYVSDNLLDWNLIQKFSTHGENECPDFYPITADNGERLWVYSGAHNHYIVGKWVDGKFAPVQEEKQLHYGSRYYAGQSFFGSEKRINICWIRENYRLGENYSQSLGFPTERNLIYREGSYYLTEKPLEIENHVLSKEEYSVRKGDKTKIELKKAPLYIEMEISGEKSVSAELLGNYVTVNPNKNKIAINGQNLPVLDVKGVAKLKLIVDKNCLEVFANEGECCTAYVNKNEFKNARISFKSSADYSAKVTVCELKKIKITEFKI